MGAWPWLSAPGPQIAEICSTRLSQIEDLVVSLLFNAIIGGKGSRGTRATTWSVYTELPVRRLSVLGGRFTGDILEGTICPGGYRQALPELTILSRVPPQP